MMRQRHLSWQRHLPAADQAHSRDGVVRRAEISLALRALRLEGGGHPTATAAYLGPQFCHGDKAIVASGGTFCV
jgi:hypothetical protein